MNVTSFFKDSGAVWISENFENVLLRDYENTGDDDQNTLLEFSDLKDFKGEPALERFVFRNQNVFLEKLMLLIQKQITGERGALLNDSSANYFFVKVKDGNRYSILVRWEPAQRLWRCGAYLQEELQIPTIRIFRPATE